MKEFKKSLFLQIPSIINRIEEENVLTTECRFILMLYLFKNFNTSITPFTQTNQVIDTDNVSDIIGYIVDVDTVDRLSMLQIHDNIYVFDVCTTSDDEKKIILDMSDDFIEWIKTTYIYTVID